MITAIIGANYGDEGKGLAVNYFTQHGKNLVVRHNGGAQSGHTVEVGDKRFVFHEIGSGTFNGAATFWDGTYHPDLYAFNKERFNLQMRTGIEPTVYCHKYATITTIDDVFLNCFKESAQFGSFGSCGMGIWECVCRNNIKYDLPICWIKEYSKEELYDKLHFIRENYSKPRLAKYIQMYGTNQNASVYQELLNDDSTLRNFVIEVKESLNHIKIVDGLWAIINQFDNVVFESGQGLLLDGELDKENGTPSRTGLYNIRRSLLDVGRDLDEVVYVTRTYLTRHGSGAFVKEFHSKYMTEHLQYEDLTNQFNCWQGGMRYGAIDIPGLEYRIKQDCPDLDPHILVTHANTTKGKFLTPDGRVDIDTLGFKKIYVSDNCSTVGAIINK